MMDCKYNENDHYKWSWDALSGVPVYMKYNILTFVAFPVSIVPIFPLLLDVFFETRLYKW